MATSFSGRDFIVNGRRLRERRWWSDKNTTAIVYVSHGFADHCGFFDKLAKTLAVNGYLVVGHDFYGHGDSEGDIRNIGSFEVLVNDTHHHLQQVIQEFPHLPVHGIGYSMGALVQHRVSLNANHQFTSQLWISPSLQPCGMRVTRRVSRCVKRMAALLPRCPVPGATFSPSDITRNPEAREQLARDPTIRQRRLTFRLMSATLELMLCTRPEDLRSPLLVIVGTDDSLADAAKSVEFVEEAQSLGMTADLIVMADCKHQLHTDAPDFDQRALVWLQSR